MMKLSGRNQPLYPHYSILEALSLIKRLGFDGIEICLEVDELAPSQLTQEMTGDIRQRVDALKLTPVSAGYHTDYIYDDHLFEETKTAIRLTPLLGTNMLIFSGTAERSGDETEWQRMVEHTRELVAIAEDNDVLLAQEFEPGFIVGTTADLLRLFSEIPSPNLAANLDLGHVFLCDNDPLDSIRQLGSKILHCHIENMRTGVHDHLLPQEGDMALGTYLSVLKQIGFEGALSLDLYKYDYQAEAPGAIAFLRGLLSEL
jgi:sugar phosphate isomerase/epimerase